MSASGEETWQRQIGDIVWRFKLYASDAWTYTDRPLPLKELGPSGRQEQGHFPTGGDKFSAPVHRAMANYHSRMAEKIDGKPYVNTRNRAEAAEERAHYAEGVAQTNINRANELEDDLAKAEAALATIQDLLATIARDLRIPPWVRAIITAALLETEPGKEEELGKEKEE
jgi:hypothetical protein